MPGVDSRRRRAEQELAAEQAAQPQMGAPGGGLMQDAMMAGMPPMGAATPGAGAPAGMMPGMAPPAPAGMGPIPEPVVPSAAEPRPDAAPMPGTGRDQPDVPGAETTVTGSRMSKERIARAQETLRKYKAGKASIERRIISSQQWWKLHNWQQIEREDHIMGADINKSNTAWLWNCVVGKHADYMDSYPEPAILPRMPDDREEATRLSEIIPVIMEQNDFEDVYSDVGWQKMLEGTGAFGVFWDPEKLNGLGDISIQKVNLLNLFWEPGIADIQDSRNVFHVALMDNDLLESQYPQLVGKLGVHNPTVAQYIYDDNVDTTDKSVVVDWYYHSYDSGKKVLQFCKFVGDEVLECTEDTMPDRGLYDDGAYPFVLDPLYPVEGQPTGYGYVAIGRDTQKDIDTISQAITMNAVVSATPRYFVRKDGAVNEAEFADLTRPLVHVDGNLGQDSLLQINTAGIQGNVINFLQNKIDELKFVTGNTDVQNGNTPSGVTAASAIAALREQSGRSSKDSTRSSWRAYRRIVNLVIERIRQFYDLPRQFRIIGKRGEERYVSYTNQQLQAQAQGQAFGMDMGYRLPVFDVDVKAQRETGYTKAAQNELALQLYQLGFFNPQMVDSAMMALDMMDFKEREELQQKLAQAGGMMQEMMQLYQVAMGLAQAAGDERAMAMLQQMAQARGMPVQPQQVPLAGAAMTEDERRTNTIISKAAEQSAQASRPD